MMNGLEDMNSSIQERHAEMNFWQKRIKEVLL